MTHIVLNYKELTSHIKCVHYQGNSLWIYIVLLDKEWAARIEFIKTILQGLPQSNHVIAISHRFIA